MLLQYHVHRVILKLGCPKQNWELEPSLSGKQSPRSYQLCPLDGLPDNVLVTVMHYLYSGSILPGLSETGARDCLNAVMKLDGLERLACLCEKYLENYAVRTRELSHDGNALLFSLSEFDNLGNKLFTK